MELTDKQWTRLEPIILQSVCWKDSCGRKPRDPREVLNGILWALRTGAPWKDLPDRCPPHQTCRRRFQLWKKAGVFRRIIEELAADLQERGGIDIREAFIDGSKKRGDAVGRTKRGKGSRIMAIVDAAGLPVAACLASASTHEVKLAETALDNLFIPMHDMSAEDHNRHILRRPPAFVKKMRRDAGPPAVPADAEMCACIHVQGRTCSLGRRVYLQMC